MNDTSDFIRRLELKVAEQINAQRVGYLLGAGSSYLDGTGYPLASQLWDLIKDRISEVSLRKDIQDKLDNGVNGLEQALDLLDDGGAKDTPYRHLVTQAIAMEFLNKFPSLDLHIKFLQHLSKSAHTASKIFSLNYDPLLERAAEHSRIRLVDGFVGAENSYFDAAIFEERIGRIRGTFRGKRFEETVHPIHLLKLHGSIGWFESSSIGVRKCAYGICIPKDSKHLMIPPQYRKAADTMLPPYSALWSVFRGCLGQDPKPLNRLVCIGYGFNDEHVNAIIEPALTRKDFTLIILTKSLNENAWNRWSNNKKVVAITESRCALYGEIGSGHLNLWNFEKLALEVIK